MKEKPKLLRRNGVWKATGEIDGIGIVSVEANLECSAKINFWLVEMAVKRLAEDADNLDHPSRWTDDEWRSALRTMKEIADE